MPKIVVVGDALIDRNDAIKFLELQPAHCSGSMIFHRFKAQGVRHNLQYMDEALAEDYGKKYIFCPDYIPHKFLTFLPITRSLAMEYEVIRSVNQIDRTLDERSVIVIDSIREEYRKDGNHIKNNINFELQCSQIIQQCRTDPTVDVYFEEGLLGYIDHKLVLGMLLSDNDCLPSTWVWDRNDPIPEAIATSPKIFKLTNRARALGSFALEGDEARLVCEMIKNLSPESIANRNFNQDINTLPIPGDAKAQLGILLQECCKDELGFTLIIQDYILPAKRPNTNLLKQFRVTATVDTDAETVEIHHMVWTGKVNETGTLTQNISNLGAATGQVTQQELMSAQERSFLTDGVTKFLLAACQQFTKASMAEFFPQLAENKPQMAKSFLLSRHGYDIHFPEDQVESLLRPEPKLLLIDKLIRAYYQWDLQTPQEIMLNCPKLLAELQKIKKVDQEDIKEFYIKIMLSHQIYSVILHNFKEELTAFMGFYDENIVSLTYDYIDRLLLEIVLPYLPRPEDKEAEIEAFKREKSNAQGHNLAAVKKINAEFPELNKVSRDLVSPEKAVDIYPQPKAMFGQAKALLEQENAQGALELLADLIDLFSDYKIIVSQQFKYEVLIMRANIAGRIAFSEEGDYDLTLELSGYIQEALQAFEKLDPELKTRDDLQIPAALMKIARNKKANLIYIPQGKIGQLDIRINQNFAVEGLYTENFSTCNIIIGISSVELTLIHADTFVNDDDILAFLQDATQIIWLYREGEERLKNNLLKREIFNNRMEEIKWVKLSDENIWGIEVTFNSSQYAKIHSNVRTYSQTQSRQLNLLRHPDEHKFVAVQKLSQIIGMREVWARQFFARKTLCIFNHFFWESIDSNEFKIDDTHPLTQEELNLFTPNDDFVTLVRKLSKFVKDSNIVMPDSSMPMNMAYYLESYLTNDDNKMLLVRNITFMINEMEDEPEITPDESAFFKRLLAFLNQSESTAEAIQTRIADFINSPSKNSKVFSIFLKGSHQYFRDYGLREEIHQYISSSKHMLVRAQKLNEQGVNKFRERNWEAALNLFQSSLYLCVRYCRVDNPMLASAYYNAGKTAYYLKQYNLALGYFEHAQFYRQKKIKPFKQSELDKVLKAMEACSAVQEDDNAPFKTCIK